MHCAFCIVLPSCKKEKDDTILPIYDYFPMQKGIYVVYDVDSVVYETSGNNTTTKVYKFQLMDVLDSAFIDGTGKSRTILVHYYRPDTLQSWALRSVWTQQLTATAAYRWEDNIPYHKLSFPISTRIEWDGNDMNTMDKEAYRYKDIHKPDTYVLSTGNAFVFDSTVTVQQVDDENFIEKHYGKEIYANHIGLIYKQRDDLRKNFGNIVSGTEYKLTVVAFGKL